LLSILDLGHLNHVGVCLDVGHAHMTVGVSGAISTLGGRIASTHIHDNHGVKDEHLWPGEGSIDWPATMNALGKLPTPPALTLEISSKLFDHPDAGCERIKSAFTLAG
jgi:sugar phosphate isomerase/epimerase